MENILVVDDEEAIREVVSTMLESKGYHCTAVQNGRFAQDQVKKLTPDLVLSDMIMPEMDGIRLLEWMRQYDPEVPVIMVTAIHDISTALEAIRRGAHRTAHRQARRTRAVLRRHAGGPGKRPGFEGCRNGRTLPAGHGVLHINRQVCARPGPVSAHPGTRCFPSRYRQDGHSRWYSAQTGAPQR